MQSNIREHWQELAFLRGDIVSDFHIIKDYSMDKVPVSALTVPGISSALIAGELTDSVYSF